MFIFTVFCQIFEGDDVGYKSRKSWKFAASQKGTKISHLLAKFSQAGAKFSHSEKFLHWCEFSNFTLEQIFHTQLQPHFVSTITFSSELCFG